MRRSLKTASWERATELSRIIEESDKPAETPERKDAPVTIVQAVTEYLADANYADSISPAMPVLSVSLPTAGCTDSVSLLLQVSYNGQQLAYWPNAYSTAGTWSTSETGSAVWNIDWSGDLDTFSDIEGGSAQFYYSVNNGAYTPDAAFTIQGVNPVSSDISAQSTAVGAPWFFYAIVPAESHGYQFYQPGAPQYSLGQFRGTRPAVHITTRTRIN